MTTDEFIDMVDYSPYFAGLKGKTDEEKLALERRINQLSEGAKDFLFDPQTSTDIQQAIAVAGLSEKYATAIAKIVFLILMGDIPATSTQQLLEKLDLSPEAAAGIAQKIDTLLAPALAAKAQAVVPKSSLGGIAGPREIPPLSHSPSATESIQAPSDGSRQNASRTIIDLRKKPTE